MKVERGTARGVRASLRGSVTPEAGSSPVDEIEREDRLPPLWSVTEIARAARLSEWAIRAALRRGELVALRRGRLLRIADAEARRFLGQ
jgi:hypothetical protein